MNEQRTDHDRGHRIARNTQRHHRDEGTADSCVIGGFRGNQAFHCALAKRDVGVLCDTLGMVVGHQGCDITARAR